MSLPASLQRSQGASPASLGPGTGAATTMIAASSLAQLGTALAGFSGPGLGAAASGVAGAPELAQLHTLVVQTTPFAEEPLSLLSALSNDLRAAMRGAIELGLFGQLLDVLQGRRDGDAASHVMSSHDSTVAFREHHGGAQRGGLDRQGSSDLGIAQVQRAVGVGGIAQVRYHVGPGVHGDPLLDIGF
jgi:hypothetical protein